MSSLTKRNIKGSNCNELLPNDDGSLNVKAEIVDSITANKETINEFGESLLLASGGNAIIATYIVPLSRTFYLQFVCFSGQNIATYEVLIDGVVIDRKRTWFNGNLADQFDFESYGNQGFKVEAASVIELKVHNFRPDAADFEGKIFGILQG